MLEVDQAAKVHWKLPQFVLTQVQLHQVCEATEIRLGQKDRTPKPWAHTLCHNSPGAPKSDAPIHKCQLYLVPAVPA